VDSVASCWRELDACKGDGQTLSGARVCGQAVPHERHGSRRVAWTGEAGIGAGSWGVGARSVQPGQDIAGDGSLCVTRRRRAAARGGAAGHVGLDGCRVAEHAVVGGDPSPRRGPGSGTQPHPHASAERPTRPHGGGGGGESPLWPLTFRAFSAPRWCHCGIAQLGLSARRAVGVRRKGTAVATAPSHTVTAAWPT
jgi:hypothetical protein